MRRPGAAREYLPASYFVCYSFLNMEPVNLTADKPEVIIWSQCRNQNTQSDNVILKCIKTLYKKKNQDILVHIKA